MLNDGKDSGCFSFVTFLWYVACVGGLAFILFVLLPPDTLLVGALRAFVFVPVGGGVLWFLGNLVFGLIWKIGPDIIKWLTQKTSTYWGVVRNWLRGKLHGKRRAGQLAVKREALKGSFPQGKEWRVIAESEDAGPELPLHHCGEPVFWVSVRFYPEGSSAGNMVQQVVPYCGECEHEPLTGVYDGAHFKETWRITAWAQI